MKFGKYFQRQIEKTLPEWRDRFLSYKRLKKRLKLIAAECFTDPAFCNSSIGGVGPSVSQSVPVGNSRQHRIAYGARASMELSDQGVEFIRLLNMELEKFNRFFIEKEEEYVIRMQEWKERIEKIRLDGRANEEGFLRSACSDDDVIRIWKGLVSIHGEMVLLLNYSLLNYTGLIKILKKHDKHTGVLLRLPFIHKILHQPFYATELLCSLVHECESKLQDIFPWSCVDEAIDQVCEDGKEDSTDVETYDEEGVYKSTIAALQTIQHLRKGSSTYSAFSLPPCSQDETLGAVIDEPQLHVK